MFHSAGGQPAIVLVDDDFHSARLFTRMVQAHGGPEVTLIGDPATARQLLAEIAAIPATLTPSMVVIDLKSSSSATRDFVAELRTSAPGLLIAAMAPSLDRGGRDALLDAGAAAVFERHADITSYRREVASLVSFWVRNQRLDAVGT